MRRLQGFAAFGVIASMACHAVHANPTPRQINEADRYCRFGARALKTGNTGKARSLFEKAMRVLPAFPDAHMGLGHVAMGDKKFEEALAEYNLARFAYVELSDALFDLQLRHHDQAQDRISRLRDEVGTYRRMIATRPFGNSAQLERGITELEQEIQQLEQVRSPAVDAKSREAPGETYFYIGNALFNLSRLDEAVRAWETCALESPRFSLVHNNLAVGYWKQGRFEEAVNSLDIAERLGLPVNPRFRVDLERSSSHRVSKASIPPNP